MRRIDVTAEGRLILVRHGEDCQQTLEGLEIPSVQAAEIASTTSGMKAGLAARISPGVRSLLHSPL
jgi:hypothetical protein